MLIYVINDVDFFVGFRIYKRRINPEKSLMLELLLDQKAHTNTKSLYGNLPIHFALGAEVDDKGRHLKDVLRLVDHSTEINTPDRNGNTPVILAAFFGSGNIIEKMIEKGADVKYQGYQRNTALHKHMGKRNLS